MAYIGNSPENIQRGRRSVYEFKATAGQTAFSGTDLNNQALDLLEENEMGVYLNGIRLADSDDYSISGDTLTLLSAASLNDQLTVETQAEVANISSYTRTETDARYINYDGDIINGTLQIAGSGNNIELGDNNKAVFGDGDDLQIYHDGSNSYVKDAGTGNLNLQGENLALENTSGDNYFVGVNGSFVKIYYSGSEKLATTSTGIDVTGTVTSDGLTSSAVITAQEGRSNTAGTGQIVIDPDDTTVSAAFRIDQTDNKLNIDMNGGGTWKKAFSVGSNNDISFYEDTGATAKFFWDASTESVQLGGTLNLQAQGSNVSTIGNNFVLNSGYKYLTSGAANMLYFDASGNTMFFKAASGTAGNAVSFSETMRINSSGNVGIGTSSPSTKLELASNDATNSGLTNLLTLSHTTTGTAGDGIGTRIVFEAEDDGGTASTMGYIDTLFTDVSDGAEKSAFAFSTRNGGSISEKMRIDSSGNVLVGGHTSTHSPVENGGSGVSLLSNGQILAGGEYPSYFNRENSDGDIIVLRKDGTALGRIGVQSTDQLYIATPDGSGVGLIFDGDNRKIDPTDGAGSNLDNAVDLGTGAYRFKDLYLSGTVNAAAINITENTNAVLISSDAIGEVGSGIFALQVNNSAGSALKPFGMRAEDIRFATGSSERMRIDSSGNLLVGKTTGAFATAGTKIAPAGQVEITAASDGSLALGRTGSYGYIQRFYKDSVIAGYIGSYSGSGGNQFYISGADTGFKFNSVVDIIGPSNANGDTRDNAISFGDAGGRFKDLYLAGGVYLGGTGSANKLEDYEEGTWTPIISGSSNAGTMNYSSRLGRYTKVGRLVTLHFYVEADQGSGSGNLLLGGAPFNIVNYHFAFGSPQWNTGISYPSNARDANWLRFNSTSFDIRCNMDNAAFTTVAYSSNVEYLRGCITYETDA